MHTSIVTQRTANQLDQHALAAIANEHLPVGVINAIVGDGEAIATALVDHSLVASVSFTGSTRVGSLISQRAMRSMTRVTMELGGKAPFIITADADPDAAVDALMIAKFRNNGASCIAANNVFIHEKLYPQILDSLREKIVGLTVGDPRSPSTEVGPLLRASHVSRLEELVQVAREDGCRVWSGTAPDSGWFMRPTLVEAASDTSLWREEIFGPVCAIRPFSDIEQVLHEIEGWPEGLAGYVMSGDGEQALNLAECLRVGIVGINNGAPNSPEVPFGGFGVSGIGREGGLVGMEEFTELQTISMAR